MRGIAARRLWIDTACLLLALWLALWAGAAGAAEPTFPALTGRVVDAAGILKPEDRAILEAKLKAYEDKTSDQVVVATIPSLQDRTIEDYGNRLFRAWKLGEATTNNGALLLVAPNERKGRIEVGYGLVGALTDARRNRECPLDRRRGGLRVPDRLPLLLALHLRKGHAARQRPSDAGARAQ